MSDQHADTVADLCVCGDGFCGGTGDLDPDEAGYCQACASLDKEDHCLVCPYECCSDALRLIDGQDDA